MQYFPEFSGPVFQHEHRDFCGDTYAGREHRLPEAVVYIKILSAVPCILTVKSAVLPENQAARLQTENLHLCIVRMTRKGKPDISLAGNALPPECG